MENLSPRLRYRGRSHVQWNAISDGDYAVSNAQQRESMLSHRFVDAETVQVRARTMLGQRSDNNARTSARVLECEVRFKMAWQERTASMLMARRI